MCTNLVHAAQALPRWTTTLGVAMTPAQGAELREQICTHSGDYYDYCGEDAEWTSEYEQELLLKDNGIESAYIVVECRHRTRVWWEKRPLGYEKMTDTKFKVCGAYVEINDGLNIEAKRMILSARELATFAHALNIS